MLRQFNSTGSRLVIALQSWIRLVLAHLSSSDYLAGMLALSMMDVARDAATRLGGHLLLWFTRRLWVTVRLEEKDADLALAWLREQPQVHSLSELTVFSQSGLRAKSGRASRIYEYEPELKVTTRLRCAPPDGGRRRWVWITRQERSDGTPDPGEKRCATVSFFGRDKTMLEAILEAGREIQRRKREKYLTVVQVYDYGKEHGLDWLHPGDKDRKQPGRSISSVVLPRCPQPPTKTVCSHQAEALLEDAREFLASESWYTERGIPYRRGYLLHGIPGGGKSSLVMAVASELSCPIYMLQLSSERMTDEKLTSLLQHGMHDPPTILLLEDVDLLHSAVLHRRTAGANPGVGTPSVTTEERDRDDDVEGIGQERKSRRGRLTLSGLLNALDGPTATTGRLLFMTTNSRERLDPALLRSGRIDYEIEFTYADPEQIERLFLRFYADFRSTANVTGDTPALRSEIGSADAASSTGVPGADARSISAAASQKNHTEALAAEFASRITASGLKLTTADIQRHLMRYKADPGRALDELDLLLTCQTIANRAQI